MYENQSVDHDLSYTMNSSSHSTSLKLILVVTVLVDTIREHTATTLSKGEQTKML